MMRDDGKGKMGDTEDGSSDAAQRAQAEAEPKKTGFFERIVGAISASDNTQGGGVDVSAAAQDEGAPVKPGMVNLRRMRVEDVMIPKAEIVSVPVEIEKDDLVAQFRDCGLTRLPVFEGTLDTPIGLVNLKDVALSYGFDDTADGANFVLRDMLRPLLYVPPSMPIGVLLQKMQTDRIHMALVIDEYGGVDGLVTIEDLIEQVIGEIEDEHDLEEGALWIEEKPGCYLAEAKAPLEEFEAEIGLSLSGDEIDDEEIDTLGGLVFVLSGHVPARGQVITHPAGPEIEVVDADPRRIKRLRVRLATRSDD